MRLAAGSFREDRTTGDSAAAVGAARDEANPGVRVESMDLLKDQAGSTTSARRCSKRCRTIPIPAFV